MIKKPIVLFTTIIIIFSLLFGYSLVFAGNIGKVYFKLSSNIFINSLELNNNRIIISSRENPNNFKITGDCGVFTKLVKSENNYHVFNVKFLDRKCEDSQIEVIFSIGGKSIRTYFKVSSSYSMYSDFFDKSDIELKYIYKNVSTGITKLDKYQIYDSKMDYFDFLKENRRLKELEYLKEFIGEIIFNRDSKYLVPIAGKSISTKLNKLPNTGRPYREDYTDGIHHGWDVDANLGDTVLAIDDGIIIRAVKDFHYTDLSKIKRAKDLSDVEKLQNLDILRGQQVWIKTSKGDVAFYSHLDKIFDNVEVGSVVVKGQPLGTVGITGVPDKNYKDYHLHIPVHKNPYIKNQKYEFIDYMQWDWYFKGKSSKYILENQGNIFK